MKRRDFLKTTAATVAAGSLGALHWAGLQSVGLGAVCGRLTAFKGPLLSAPVLVLLWLLYLAGTATALACSGAQNRGGPERPRP